MAKLTSGVAAINFPVAIGKDDFAAIMVDFAIMEGGDYDAELISSLTLISLSM